MKKKILAAALACMMVFDMTACGGAAKWTEEDFTFKGAENEITLKEGQEMIVYEDTAYVREYDDGSYEEYAETFATAKGLEIGMELSDYKKLYSVVKGYAIWEIYSGTDGMYTSFAEYNNQDPAEIYDSEDEVTNVWLDLGFYKENGKWVAMEDVEVQDVWFCEADLEDYEECVILSVNIDTDGTVIGLGCNYFTYDEDWVEWQAWEE